MRKLFAATVAAALLPLCAHAQGLPGMRGSDHLGITVPNVQQATDFFVDVLGCEAFFPMGPFASDDDWMQVHLGVDPRAEVPAMRLVRCAYGVNLEIFEYTVDGQDTTPPLNSDIGGHHLAFYVDDIDAAVAHLAANNVKMLGDPTYNSGGPNAGTTWLYFLAPWGMNLEIVEYNDGLAYESDYENRLWTPLQPGM